MEEEEEEEEEDYLPILISMNTLLLCRTFLRIALRECHLIFTYFRAILPLNSYIMQRGSAN